MRYLYDDSIDCFNIEKELRDKDLNLILIGNSMLIPNIDQKTLEDDLSLKYGRKINTMFISLGDSTIEWWYLILKNQIIANGVKDIPVGIIFKSNELTYKLTDIDGEYLYYIQNNLKHKDYEFFEKTADRFFNLKYNFKTYYYRWRIAQKILHKWMHFSQIVYMHDLDSESIMEDKFNISAFREDDSLRSCELRKAQDFFEVVEGSFLPNLINLTDSSKLFFIEVHRRPEIFSMEEEAHRRYRKGLYKYLSERGIKVISLVDLKSLGDCHLYKSVSDHLTPRGVVLNTGIVAQKLYENNIIK